MWCITLHWVTGEIFSQIGLDLGFFYEKPLKRSQKSYFLLLRETLKIYNLATTNAIPMKLTKIMYLHETFHLAKNWGVSQRAEEGVIKKPLKSNHKMSFFGLISWNFEDYMKNHNVILDCITFPNFKRIWPHLGEFDDDCYHNMRRSFSG